jgi:hypothetical protein
MVSPAWLIVCKALGNRSKALLQTILDANQLRATTPAKTGPTLEELKAGWNCPV